MENSDSEPPSRRKPKGWKIFVIGLSMTFLSVVFSGRGGMLAVSEEVIIEGEVAIMKIVQGNSFVAISPIDSSFGEEKLSNPDRPKPDIRDICYSESKGNPKVCNFNYGCVSGMGLCQIVSSTWNSTLDRMTCSGEYATEDCVMTYLPERCIVRVDWRVQDATPQEERTHPIFDKECHLIVASWLLEADGAGHWEQSRYLWEETDG